VPMLRSSALSKHIALRLCAGDSPQRFSFASLMEMLGGACLHTYRDIAQSAYAKIPHVKSVVFWRTMPLYVCGLGDKHPAFFSEYVVMYRRSFLL
jgi:hypothetical protein